MRSLGATIMFAMAVTAGAGSARAVEPLSPAGLVAEGGDARVWLDWNPSTFDEVVGYHVYRSEGTGKAARITKAPVARPEYVDEAATNGRRYTYTVTGVRAGGKETPASPAASATPGKRADPKRDDNTFVFHDGQQITLDGNTMKLVSWKSPKGLELASSTIYDCPIRLTEFDERGLSFPAPATEESPVMTTSISKRYTKAQRPKISVENGRVKVFYRIPLAGFGVPANRRGDSWIWAGVWETWYPIERKIGSTVYRGIARRIELDVPSVYKDGFQLNLNDAFGINGSCKDAVSYRAFTWGSRMKIIHWDPNKASAETSIRRSSPRPFHPDQGILNVHPFLFVDHPKGTLIFTAQRQHYAIHAALSNYADQKKDGLWPNFAVDLDNPGRRFCVDTFEYLFSPDRALAAPQRYIDARMHYLRRMAEIYGYPTRLPGVCVGLRTYPTLEKGDYAAMGEAEGKRLAAEGVDLRHDVYRTWLTAPYARPELMRNADAPPNRAIAAFNAGLKKHGVAAGFWFRAEVVKTARGNIFSEKFWTNYHGYHLQKLPPLIPLLERQGLPLIRNNTAWIRKGRGGRYFDEIAGRTDKLIAAYNWTPMSLKGGWYDEVLYPTFKMAKKLGFTGIFFDGGFGGYTGVDYTHGSAIAMQPYWTRMIRTAAHFGLVPIGECGIGAGVMFSFGPSSEKRHGKMPWMFAGCPLMQGPACTEEWMHKLHQVYAMPFQDRGACPRAHAFAREFLKKNGPPDRVVLQGLRPAESKQTDHWVYDGVFWEYADGRRVEYPNSLPAK